MARIFRLVAALAAVPLNAFVLPEGPWEHHWAVIVAGSNGYGNYRHQADACHAYQIAKRKGIPEKQIILFMYDDIAHSKENPIPGKVFNRPDGKDVYHGCKASYTGKDVSAAKFLAVLTGDKKTAKGPVLRSSKRDNVFIYYADHGAPGLIAMPEDEEPVYAKDLNNALVAMKKKDMYNRLVFYLEACESGSMFKGILAEDTKVYATTAANEKESSFGTYCDEDAVVNGTSLCGNQPVSRVFVDVI